MREEEQSRFCSSSRDLRDAVALGHSRCLAAFGTVSRTGRLPLEAPGFADTVVLVYSLFIAPFRHCVHRIGRVPLGVPRSAALVGGCPPFT